MGPHHSYPQQPSISQYFQVLQSFQIPSKNKDQPLFKMKGRIPISNSAFLSKWEERLSSINKLNNNYLLLPTSWEIKQSTMCGQGSLVQIEYNDFPNVFSNELQTRSKKQAYLDQSQFWYLISILAEVAWCCNQAGQKIGDIKPNNIFMNNQGLIKILTVFSIPTPIQPYFGFEKIQSYLAPEQLMGRRKGCMQNPSNPIKAESFAIGMTLLSVALLHNLFHLYNYSTNEINQQLLQQYLVKLDSIQYFSNFTNSYQRYSLPFKTLLKSLIFFDPAARVTSLQIHKHLEKYRDCIYDMAPFQMQPLYPEVVQGKSLIKLGQSSPNRDCINLRSRKKGVPDNQGDKRNKLIKQPEVTNLIESKYVEIRTNSPVRSAEGSNQPDLLRQIDERLKRSREEFPS